MRYGTLLDNQLQHWIVTPQLQTVTRRGWRLSPSPPLRSNVSQIVKGRKHKPLGSPQHSVSFRTLAPFPQGERRTRSGPRLAAAAPGAARREEIRSTGRKQPPPAGREVRGSEARRVRGPWGAFRLRPRARLRRGLARRPSPGLAAPRRQPYPAIRAQEAARRRTSGRGRGTYQLLPNPAPHAPAVAVPVPRHAGAEGLQVEADEPEGEAGVPLWLKFRSPPPPPHSPRRVPISPRRPWGPTGAAPAPPPPGAAEPAATPQPPSLLTAVTRSTTNTPPSLPGPPAAPGPAPGSRARPRTWRKRLCGPWGPARPAAFGNQSQPVGGASRECGQVQLLPSVSLAPIPGVGLNLACLSPESAVSCRLLFLLPVAVCLLWYPRPPKRIRTISGVTTEG